MDLIQRKMVVVEQCLDNLEKQESMSERRIARLAGVSRTLVKKISEKVKQSPDKYTDIRRVSSTEFASLVANDNKPMAFKEPIEPHYWIALGQKYELNRGQLFELYQQEASLHPYGHSTFCSVLQAHALKHQTTMLLEHEFGTAQVDFAGKRPRITDPETGEKTKVELFVATLVKSNYTFLYACKTQSIDDWILAHKEWMKFLNAVPKLIITDNLKAAVITAGKNFDLNKRYEEFVRHYDSNVLPARVYHPNDKAKVELEVRHAGYGSVMSKLANKTFFSIDELNDAIRPLLYMHNERKLKGLRFSRSSLFAQAEREHLKPMPVREYSPTLVFRRPRVTSTYHVEYDNKKYSVPYDLQGKYVDVRVTETQLRCYYDNALVAEHKLIQDKRDKSTLKAHMDPKHVEQSSLMREQMLDWAENVGPNSKLLIAMQYEARSHQFHHVTSDCSAFKKLAHKIGPVKFEAIAQKANQRSCHSIDVFKALIDSQGDNHETAR